ncbi:hypothetical protein NEOLEDRAFT_218511 [Neolentinus lepideus HHB14362 ss-1]|uniref:Uncharacterized protein n=1 Tax=Neolentinus lepideus HHB14362 ss-1 TaxID=1314782 RepID=A0A165MBC1_9AGAM|nr:hypothetical protein NEOLEDRAFT_218511 [Neolentinus lepideus HHB14362 ss-1]
MDKADISPFVVHSSSDATNHPTSLTSVPILVSSFTPSSRKTRLYTSQTENEPSQPSLRDTVDPSLVSATSPAGTRNPQSPEWTSRIDSLQEQMDRLIEEQLVLTREVHHVIAPPTYDGHSQE